TVVSLDEKHSRSEIWREIGATYEAADMCQDARAALEKYVERRPFDPEGLYYFGKTLNRLEEAMLAREMHERCIEAVKTAPYYRRGPLRRWQKLAQEQLRAPQAQPQGASAR